MILRLIFIAFVLPPFARAELLCFDVENMTCSSCVKKIKTKLMEVPKIKNVQVDLKNAQVNVQTLKTQDIDPQKIIELLKSENYPAKQVTCPASS